jgi:hypothetical protein
LPALAAKERHAIEWLVDTALRPGVYELAVRARAADAEVEAVLNIGIVARLLPLQMPVVMWGGGDLDRLTTEKYGEPAK